MLHNKSVLAVIPARSGSQGIKNKNICLLGGETLVARTAKVCKQLNFIDLTVVSTDDNEIAIEGIANGAMFIKKRPDVLSSDHARAIDVWIHEWTQVERKTEKNFDISIYLEPTSPFRSANDISESLELLIRKKVNSVITVSRTPAHFTPHKSLSFDRRSSKVNYFMPGSDKFDIRQNIPPLFHRNGACYAATKHQVIDHKKIISDQTLGLVLDRPMVNIDTIEDLEYARYLFSKMDIK